jgi:membrane protein involved in colicin uptake
MSEQLKAKAKEYFEQYPKEEIIYITSDGQVFLSANRHDGQNHQRSLKEGEITPVRRSNVMEGSGTVKLSDEEEDDLAELERLRLQAEEEAKAADEEARLKAEEEAKAAEEEARLKAEEEEKAKAAEEEARLKAEEEAKAAEEEARLKAEEEEKAKKNKGTKNK